VLIHDSHPDVRLFHSLLRSDFLSWWLRCCNGLWRHYSVCLTRSRTVSYRTNTIHELLCPLIHLLQRQTWVTILNFHLSMNFNGFHPFTTLLFDASCKQDRHLYTTTVPLCCIAASSYHLLATLQTRSINVVNLQDNWAVFWIFIEILRFSFDSLIDDICALLTY
jgi:hypothetical protein